MRRSGAALLALGAAVASLLIGIPPSSAEVVSFDGDRPYKLIIPTTYDKSKPAPLILALHGYTSSGDEVEKYLKLTDVAEKHGMLYVHPDGSKDTGGMRFWNATPACCNFSGSTVDDEAYLMSIIDSISRKYNVDQKRIYIVGHSNGGFMTHRMACTHADRIAAVVSLSGATFNDTSACKPKSPISVLQIWGTADETILYKGGRLENPYPSANKTVSSWAKLNGCNPNAARLAKKLDLESTIKGNETVVSQYSACPSKTAVTLWTINGGRHVPTLVDGFAEMMVSFLLAHPKV
jgi:polyhydroxybutyrate depolymerase